MITKEELLEKLLETRICDKHRAILNLALKGLEYEKIEGQEFIPLGEHLLVVGGLTRSRNLWRKKYDELADELDDKIIALEEKLKDKDASLAEASKTINDALTMQILQAQLTESMASHHASVDDANRQIIALRNERNAFQRLVGELEIEKSCIRADLENVCKERDALKDKIEELETELGSKDDDWRLSVSYYMNLAAAWEKQAKALKAKIEKCEAVLAGKELK